MDRRSLLLASLQLTTGLEKVFPEPLSPSAGMHSALLDVPRSAPRRSVESRLMLDLLKAETALEDYRNAMAEDLALRNLARKREALRVALLPPPRNAQRPVNPLSLLADTCVIPVKHKAPRRISEELPQEISSLYSMRRPSDVGQSMYPPKTKKPLVVPVKEQLQVPKQKKERRQTKCWDVSVSFPSKLFNMLEEGEKAGHEHIVSFLPDGKAFMIHKPELFAQEILPKYFKTSRLSSFQKQLSLYGFKRIRYGADLGAIEHEFFQRGEKKLVAKIQRKRQRVPEGEPVDQQKERAAIWRALQKTGRKCF